MPAASTGYEVVTQAFSSSSPMTLSAPSNTRVVWAFVTRDSDGSIEDYRQQLTIEPTFSSGDIVSVDFTDANFGASPARTAHIVCVGV